MQHDAEPPRLVGQQLALVRLVEVRDLEERRRRAARQPVAGHGLQQARQEQRPHEGVVGRERVLQATTSRRGSSGARPVRSASPASTSDSVTASWTPAAQAASTAPADRWLRVSPPPWAPKGSRDGSLSRPWMRATSSTRSISRVMSSQRGRRDGDVPAVAGAARLEAEPVEDPRPPRSPSISIPRIAPSRRSRRSTIRRAPAAGRRRRSLGQPSARPSSSTSSRAAALPQPAARCGSTPLIQRFRRRCAGRSGATSGDAGRGRSWPPRARPWSVVSAISEPAPPMMPAMPSGPSASAITSMSGVSVRSLPSSVDDRLARPGEARDQLGAGDLRRVVARAAGCRGRASRSS